MRRKPGRDCLSRPSYVLKMLSMEPGGEAGHDNRFKKGG